MDLAHPLRVAGGQVVVDGDQVDPVAGEGVQVDGQGGDQRLALARLHLGDPAEVEGHAPHELDVEVALAEDPPGASRTTAKASTSMSSRVSPSASRWRNTSVGARSSASGSASISGSRSLTSGNQLGQPTDLLPFAGAKNLGENAHELTHSTVSPWPGGLGGTRFTPVRATRCASWVACRARTAASARARLVGRSGHQSALGLLQLVLELLHHQVHGGQRLGGGGAGPDNLVHGRS